VRIKSRWHKSDKPKSMQQIASVMAFIVWRVSQNALKRMRTEQYDIDPGQQYFAFLSELLIFLIQIADRIAYQRLDTAQRDEFTTALAIRVAEILDDNQSDLLGSLQAGSYKGRFIASTAPNAGKPFQPGERFRLPEMTRTETAGLFRLCR